MSKDIYFEVKTNFDFSVDVKLHKALHGFMDDIITEGADFLRVAVPKGDTLELTKHVGHTGPYDDGQDIVGHVGIPLISKKSLGTFDPNSMRYPIFVDEGTGIYGDHHSPIFSKRSDYMKLPPDGIHSIFQKETKGQRGQHFMEKTYEFMKASLKPNSEKFKTDLKTQLKPSSLS